MRGVNEDHRARDASARAAFNQGRVLDAFALNSALLRDPQLPERERPRIEANRDLCAPEMEAALLVQASERRRVLSGRTPSAEPEITLTVTTCRRLELFVRALDSFLVACTDIERIERFVCIDDGSSQADRDAMRERYPFFEFILKSDAERGHARSMNSLRETVRSKYWLHLEDDFQFFEPRAFIAEGCAILEREPDVAQVLFNRGYAEDTQDRNVDAGQLRFFPSGARYWIHVYEPEPAPARLGRRSLSFWPHFSLRPSLMRTERILAVGQFDESPIHFEREFAERYTQQGNRSAFLDTICSRHIGRLLEERDTGLIPNAYQLNGQRQFGEAEPPQIRVTVGIVARALATADAISSTIESLREQCEDPARVGAWLCASDGEPRSALDDLAARLPFVRFVQGGFQSVLAEAPGRYLLCAAAGQEFRQRFSVARAIEQLVQGDTKLVALDGAAVVSDSGSEPYGPCLLEVHAFRALATGGEQSLPKTAFEPIPADAEWWRGSLRDRQLDVFCIPYDFWPAFEPALVAAPDGEVRVEQSTEAMRAAVARAAQRVQACRELAIARGLSDAPPDVRTLASNEPPQRVSFENDEGETIRIDETLAIARLTEHELMFRSRLEWLSLCWLCWAAGLNAVGPVHRVLPRPEVHDVLLSVAACIERLQNCEPSSAQHFHRLDEARLPASALAILAQYYQEVRAVLLFACDPECRSPWQDDLGRDEAIPLTGT